MNHSTRDRARRLDSIAHEQQGYFTAKQALKAGYGYPHIEYHVSTGRFERVDHGVYRMTNILPGDHDDLIRWTLWSRNRNEETQAVVSHETALVHHGLSELLPNKLHFTVPPKFRKVAPAVCVLHHAILDQKETEERAGFRVTTPLRTLLDIVASGVSREQRDIASRDAISRGLVRRKHWDTALKMFLESTSGMKKRTNKK